MQSTSSDHTASFLALAPAAWRQRCTEALAAADGDWAKLQRTFLDWVDEYARQESQRAPDYAIDSHEAGGAWRIIFPHLRVRGDAGVLAHMAAVMDARRRFAGLERFHGFHDEAEVHHEIETFLYFQMPLWFLTANPVAAESIEDLAHHVGNWVAGVPAWYDWASRGFVSTWLGTRGVRSRPPYDYQEANHWRFVEAALAAHSRTHDARYQELATSYATRWCEHIERARAAGGPIGCQILPDGAVVEEAGKAGVNTSEGKYQIFYYTAAVNTAYDVFCGLTDVFRLTGDGRCLAAAQALLDQFFANARDGTPAISCSGGQWRWPEVGGALTPKDMIQQWPALLARMAMRHDLLTGQDRYRKPMLDWAATIDEHAHSAEQTMCDVLTAAHFYSGESAFLARAYAMALRTWAVTSENDQFAMCSAVTRGGAKFMMESLYQPLLASSDWGTRGNMPLESLQHVGGSGAAGMPAGAAFRAWRTGGAWWCEAKAPSPGPCGPPSPVKGEGCQAPVQWRVQWSAGAAELSVPPGGRATAKIE